MSKAMDTGTSHRDNVVRIPHTPHTVRRPAPLEVSERPFGTSQLWAQKSRDCMSFEMRFAGVVPILPQLYDLG